MSIDILIPVLNRPHRVRPVAESIRAASVAIDCEPWFICTPGDREEIEAIHECEWASCIVMPGPRERGDYARKINFAAYDTAVNATFLFLAADDLFFHPGWAERAVAAWYETGACVIGTNDLANPTVKAGNHATHSLVHRDYLDCGTADEEGKLLHEGYDHNFVDNEFIETAAARQTYTQALDSHVEHSHPIWGTADMDDTYAIGRAQHSEDMVTYTQRRALWT